MTKVQTSIKCDINNQRVSYYVLFITNILINNKDSAQNALYKVYPTTNLNELNGKK